MITSSTDPVSDVRNMNTTSWLCAPAPYPPDPLVATLTDSIPTSTPATAAVRARAVASPSANVSPADAASNCAALTIPTSRATASSTRVLTALARWVGGVSTVTSVRPPAASASEYPDGMAIAADTIPRDTASRSASAVS